MLQTTTQLPFSAKLFSVSSPPPKKPSTRDREYLRSPEVKAMIRAAKKVGRHGSNAKKLIFDVELELPTFFSEKISMTLKIFANLNLNQSLEDFQVNITKLLKLNFKIK